MSEMLKTSVPWGALAVNEEVADKADIEIVLLQQSIIDGQNKELSEAGIKLDVTQKRCIQLDTDKTAAESKIEELETERAYLNDRINELELQEVSVSPEQVILEGRVVELEAELEIANKTKNEILKRNHDQERKLESARYQKDTTQRLFDEQRQDLIKRKTECDALRIENQTLTAEQGDTAKYIKQIEDELLGVAARINNAVAAERARCEEVRSKEVSELKGHLKIALQTKGDEGEARSQLNEKIQRLESEVQVQRDLAVAAGDLVKAHEEEKLSLKAQADKEREVRENIAKGYARQAVDYDMCKRDNLLLAGMLEHMEMKKVWEHEDGTDVFIINTNPSQVHMYDSEAGDDEQPFSSSHPAFWIMNGDSTGHIALLSEDGSKMIYPDAAKEGGCKFKAEHEASMLAAMQAMTIDEFNKALERSQNYHYNVSMSAEFLDIEWGAAYDAARIIKAVKSDPKFKEIYEQAYAASDFVNEQAGLYKEKLKAAMKRARTANKPRAKKKKKR